jgi:proteasome lid subunit RPN8/RPN11
MEIYLPPNIKKQMVSHSRHTYPEECCGFFYGTEKHQKRLIHEITCVENTRTTNKRRRFEVSHRDYMKAEQKAQAEDLTLLGVYHSHPDHPAEPSEHDRQQAMPFFSYIIISVEEGALADITSWQLNHKRKFEQETINFESIQLTKTI